ncbi:hypothetical protein Psesu_1129 [Pseudoxanthomonas suwonensis 11-1]|uniref:Uncharacterized protein n=1 Tax=Pseudoxanthomonas suwonensis (strain 11-1) TaxID=743721 RepID=E6WS30_PSEUU|nr:hypothetical protein [Pseudoxanthomonas suwonensis]ADV26979.1 hypothetical protein Psesu_1129 [Pseudoxanthomonas suwonensis 11-1]
MSDTQFIDGLMAKAPHENAPEYVKAKLSIKREELIAWLQQQGGDWINAEVKVSGSSGKWYVAVDQWRPDRERGGQQRSAPQRQAQRSAPATRQDPVSDDGFADDDIPF